MTKVAPIDSIKNSYKYFKPAKSTSEELLEKQTYILSLFKQGKNKSEIAEILGISRALLSRIWKFLKMDDAIKTDMQNCFNAGKSMKDISKEYNRTLPTCYNMAWKHKLIFTKQETLLARKNEILELRAQGKTKIEIAEALGVPLYLLNSAMSRLGISTLKKDSIQGMTKNKLLELKQRYKTKANIAEATQMSLPTVYRLFHLFNIK